MARITKDKLIVSDLEEFRPHAIFECGQIFRYKQIGEDYEVISEDKRAKVVKVDGGYEILTDTPDYFYDFFDFGTDYESAKAELNKFDFLQASIQNSQGIRLLRQSHFETIISFIISANNNIPRIKGIISRLASALGENKGDYFAFPTAEKMASQNEDFYLKLGAGYRAPCLLDTARKIAEGFEIERLDELSTPKLTAHLMKLLGVGPKVADCIALFSYARWDVFPVDTWIKKVYVDVFGKEENPAKIRKDFTSLIGNKCGLAQQYLFFNKRG